jgi:hypothetical protein
MPPVWIIGRQRPSPPAAFAGLVAATREPGTRAASPDALAPYRVAQTSAARTRGSLQRALRVVRKIITSRNPAFWNSSRKAPPSFAPAIQANHSASVNSAGLATASFKTSSAAKTHPPGRTTRASSRNICSRAGFRLKIPLTRAM